MCIRDRLIASGVIKKNDIIIKLDKKVLERLLSPLSCILIFFLTINPFLFKYFFISKIEYFFFMPISQPLLLLQVNNDIKDSAHLALKSLLN